MKAHSSITGAIFCGGKSSRMGIPKAGILLPNGRTMIEQVHAALAQVCSKIVLVGHTEGVPASLSRLPQIYDRHESCGPLGALEVLLSSCLAKEYLITPCDLPQVISDTYRCLLSSKVSAPAVLSREGRIEPLIGRYSIGQLSLARRLIKEKKFAMYDLVSAAKAQVIELPRQFHFTLHNANRKEDLIQLV